jgi:ribosomal protein S18 acetylase RimI-like enzyme
MPATRSAFELRSAGPADQPFLRRLYASRRAGEMALTGWKPAQVDAFLEMQFGARERQYGEQYPSREDRLILVDGLQAGRFCIDRGLAELVLVDIALLPEHQGTGIGTALIEGLQREATAARLMVTLHVAAGNPAARLYRRLGFAVESGDGVYEAMRWRPQFAGAGREQ